jgi:mRNA-degrading endonuclease RelE of RelBE toxin-antitoxin system
MPHEVYLHAGLLEQIPRSGPQRQKILAFIRHLRDHPEARGDFTDKDASLRQRQIKIIGEYAVTYWYDAPVKTVMVVDVSLADQ